MLAFGVGKPSERRMSASRSGVNLTRGRYAVAKAVRQALSASRPQLLASALWLASATVLAQEQPSEPAGGVLGEVTVTGTRIVRDGYEAPTPVSVLGVEELSAMAVTNIVDAVNRLPALSPTVSTRNSPAVDMTGGIQNLNLRGLGPTRTLVLLDGKRIVGSTLAGFDNNGGAVDINAFPNVLISRVDVVTGGASAVYGSDALAGVVNFVLDKEFTGVKGEAMGGITTYADDESHKVSFAAGMPFGEDDRGHVLFAGENTYTRGILHNDRPWGERSYSLMLNPTYAPGNGQPRYISAFDTGLAVATRGGLIVGCNVNPCPLRGTQFLDAGTPAPFQFGPTISGLLMSGGDWQTSRIDNDGMPDLNLRRSNAFGRASYEVGENTTVYGEVLWSRTHSRSFSGVPQFHLGNVNVRSGNPFIPDSIQDQMTALGISQLTMGTTNADLPQFGHNNVRRTLRYVAGAEGAFDAFGSSWTWDASFETSTTHVDAKTPGTEITANFRRAIDTVIDPASGRYVCAVNVDADPTNDDPACVPFNVMGIGVNSRAAVDYVTGTGWTLIDLEQDVFATSVSGEPVSTWAGPVSLAFGAEHRRESVVSSASDLDQARGFFAGNFTASRGKYDVTEGFLETVVPLAKDKPLARSLDLNGAARWTDYSTSGEVVTWKLGATWSPIDDLRFRATRSRDIRAPNLGELFNTGRSGTGAVTDPANGGATAQIVTRVRGNPNLEPEEADTTGLGLVYQPGWFAGFGASIDYYKIEIDGAIVSLGNQAYVDRCFAGDTTLCGFIERNSAGVITAVSVLPANVLVQSTEGIDLELSYRFDLSSLVGSWDGSIALRGMATYVDSLKTVDDQSIIEGAGVNADSGALGVANGLFVPTLRYLVSATYDRGSFSGTLTARGIDAGAYNNSFISCTANCPVSTAPRPTIDNNHIDAVTYFDLSLNYDVFEEHGEAFFVVENLLNEAPPLVAGTANNGFYAGQGNGDYYDRIGRIYRAGMRFKF